MSPYTRHSEHSGRSHLSQAQNNDQISLYTVTVVQVIKNTSFINYQNEQTREHKYTPVSRHYTSYQNKNHTRVIMYCLCVPVNCFL